MAELPGESRGPLLVAPRLTEGGSREAGGDLQVPEQRRQMRPHLGDGPEVREQERRGRPRENAFDTPLPELQIDVWRRRGRQHEPTIDAHAGRVADKRDATRWVVVAHMVRGVPGRVRHVERASAGLDPLSTAERDQVLSRHGGHLSPPVVHAFGVDATRTRHEARRVGHVTGAAFVHDYLDVWMSAGDRAGGTSVVQMDVRQQEVPDVAPRHAERLEAGVERLEATGGSGIDQGHAARAAHEAGRNDVRSTLKSQIDPG